MRGKGRRRRRHQRIHFYWSFFVSLVSSLRPIPLHPRSYHKIIIYLYFHASWPLPSLHSIPRLVCWKLLNIAGLCGVSYAPPRDEEWNGLREEGQGMGESLARNKNTKNNLVFAGFIGSRYAHSLNNLLIIIAFLSSGTA